ncbi:hypothetical protein [Ferruginibacter sp. SUN106]|uniref:hypothetical protein n=1 Tax=Ferruginibacter sp. SUN106 TaxID=2978348 RepID=UPI003D35A9CB
MKNICVVVQLFCIHQAFAQPETKKKQVMLSTGEHNIVLKMKEYFDAAAQKSIIDQVGQAKYDAIVQSITEADLPACYTTTTGKRLSDFTMYKIAEYTTLQYDAFGLYEEKATYDIIEVPLSENKDLQPDCKMSKTFYIRIPAAYVQSVIASGKTTSSLYKDQSAKINAVPYSLASLGKIYLPCDKFTAGTYNGEQTNSQPDGYGAYLFEDSSFYCGSFVKGKVTGNGVLYNATKHTAYIGNWENGKLTGDFYEVACRNYAVNINTVNGAATLTRAKMWINEETNRIATGNILHAFATEKLGMYNNYNAYGTVDISYSGFTDKEAFLRGKTADFYSDGRESEIFNMSAHKTFAPNTDKDIFEKELTYPVPDILYPCNTINLDNNYKYFGKTVNNIAEGYGNIVSKWGCFSILTGMFSNGKPYGFKQNVYNDKNKFFYAGEFDLAGNAHKGNYIKVNYANPSSLSIFIGSFSGDEETMDKGIQVEIAPANKAVTFKYTQANVGRGYIMFPMQNVVYRGALLNVSAEGTGEVLQNGTATKGNYKAGKLSGYYDNFPQWVTPVFTDIFNTPFNLPDKLK